MPPGYESPDVPKYRAGDFSVVPRDDPAWTQVPEIAGDSKVRLCRSNTDGTYKLVIVDGPADPKNPFPDGDRTRPC